MSSEENISNDPFNHRTIDFGIYYLDIVECPLDPNHKLRRHRLPYHILKCKKAFPDKIQCPYGHYYYSEKHEMANHLLVCPHKPMSVQADEMQPSMIQVQQAKNENIVRNYDVDKYEIDEPYWD
ncbi:gametocyte-specific factor 1-like [Melanaphis sacchari]|uniref:gametocyte-specific factor 1-like n=1 Tax=Melanaphis sacchari TaxID=742174 RepID=UPI000DC1508A|nr:gametocyte-specific factor 1-like [Melanaphis sacchari]XP_025192134.1 gametocyte-specific factor 1-like [Melanaphis sacchari]XP_025192135.1 gametocyte-specific factor 1-like [Melanaphis sacchari]